MNVPACWNRNPDGLVEGAFLEIVKWVSVVLGAVGVRTTLPAGEVLIAVVLVIFKGKGLRPRFGGLLLRFGVHVISFPTGSRPIYKENTVVFKKVFAFSGTFLLPRCGA
jgi:hypothetical protein